MTSRYTYATTLAYSTGEVPEVDEVEVEVSFTVTWGRPETPPAYDHGGLPADPDEINNLTLLSIDGVGGPFDQHSEAAILQEIAQNHTEAMLAEACDHEAAWDDAAADYRREARL
jgi:hypothetical protein